MADGGRRARHDPRRARGIDGEARAARWYEAEGWEVVDRNWRDGRNGEIDLVLIMSVNPGFGGQAFIASQLKKIAAVRKMIEASGRDIRLEVDGGINPDTARQCLEAGADVLVAGSATLAGGPARYADNIAALRGAG